MAGEHDVLALALPDLPAGQWLLPSYSLAFHADGTGTRIAPARYGYRFGLHWRTSSLGGAGSAALASVGAAPQAATEPCPADPLTTQHSPAEPHPAVATPIDAFVTRAALAGVTLTLERWRDAGRVPEAGAGAPANAREWLSCEWLSCSTRPEAIAAVAGHLHGGDAPAAHPAATPPAYSQMTLPEAVRHRVCSPVSLAMACSALGRACPREYFLDAVRHSDMYGVWPANIHAASRVGVLAATELFTHPDEVVPLLRSGVQVIVSTRWRAGELHGAPLEASAGHLMLLRALDADWAHVHDPAAADDAGVMRRYARGQFCRIWLAERGAAYLLLPACPTPPDTPRS